MCLNMGSQPSVPLSPLGIKHQKILYIVMFVHLALTFMMLFLSVMSGITELITVLILFCATSKANFCYLLFYMYFIMFAWVTDFAMVGLVI